MEKIHRIEGEGIMGCKLIACDMEFNSLGVDKGNGLIDLAKLLN